MPQRSRRPQRDLTPKSNFKIKDKNIRNLFATEITEATEGFTFKNQKEKANACGTCFEGAGSNSLPFSASIFLCSLCPLWLNNFLFVNFRHFRHFLWLRLCRAVPFVAKQFQKFISWERRKGKKYCDVGKVWGPKKGIPLWPLSRLSSFFP